VTLKKAQSAKKKQHLKGFKKKRKRKEEHLALTRAKMRHNVLQYDDQNIMRC
jgi:hypothetical protein